MRRYAICGVSSRAIHTYIKPLTTVYTATGELVALLDADPLRFDVCRAEVPVTQEVPTYDENSFDALVEATRPDMVMVLGRDDTHAGYILSALDRDLDVIVEKPMVTTAADAARVLETEAASGGTVAVTFNFRNTATHQKIKEMIAAGAVGRITSLDFNSYTDTRHGASYFRRWNRRRECSGGLSVHKCCHHFDLLNWWIDQEPVEVFAYGALNHFGAGGEMNPRKVDGRHCATCTDREVCAYVRRWQDRGDLINVDVPRSYTGSPRNPCCFDSDIDIEDTYTAVIRYSQGVTVSYSANYSCPYEGYRLAINGTRGRIETQGCRRAPVPMAPQTIDYFPLFGTAKQTIHPLNREGGHGGSDPVILEELFLGPDPTREHKVLAGARDGALAVAMGEGVWRSCQSGRPERIADLLSAPSQLKAPP